MLEVVCLSTCFPWSNATIYCPSRVNATIYCLSRVELISHSLKCQGKFFMFLLFVYDKCYFFMSFREENRTLRFVLFRDHSYLFGSWPAPKEAQRVDSYLSQFYHPKIWNEEKLSGNFNIELKFLQSGHAITRKAERKILIGQFKPAITTKLQN